MVGVPFPKNYHATVKKIMTRLFRVFVHIYMHHFDKLVALGAVSFGSIDVLKHCHCVGRYQNWETRPSHLLLTLMWSSGKL